MKTKIVCYCGSLRVAINEFKKQEYDAVMRGEIALLPACMFGEPYISKDEEYKKNAHELHKRKIDMCDEVVILNVNGTIGESTRGEIDYAKSIGKPIRYIECPHENEKLHQGDGFIYKTCADCGCEI